MNDDAKRLETYAAVDSIASGLVRLFELTEPNNHGIFFLERLMANVEGHIGDALGFIVKLYRERLPKALPVNQTQLLDMSHVKTKPLETWLVSETEARKFGEMSHSDPNYEYAIVARTAGFVVIGMFKKGSMQ